MIYVMADIHGHYDKYIKMLEQIQFSDNDTLYVLGDVIDRSSDGIKQVPEIMNAPNMVLILSNQKKYFLNIQKIIRCIITRFLL